MADERQPYRKCKKMRSFSLCPEDLPESAYVKSEKNGKTYFNFLIDTGTGNGLMTFPVLAIKP